MSHKPRRCHLSFAGISPETSTNLVEDVNYLRGTRRDCPAPAVCSVQKGYKIHLTVANQ